MDQEYAQRYNIKAFPDRELIKKYIECIEGQERRKSNQNGSALKEYVLNAMGGFEIDGWSLRTPLSVDLSR